MPFFQQPCWHALYSTEAEPREGKGPHWSFTGGPGANKTMVFFVCWFVADLFPGPQTRKLGFLFGLAGPFLDGSGLLNVLSVILVGSLLKLMRSAPRSGYLV